jgi:hypothetical protein
MKTFDAEPAGSVVAESVIRYWPTRRGHDWAKAFLDQALLDDNVLAVLAIGSGVRAHHHDRSDVDLIVLHDGAWGKPRAPIDIDVRAHEYASVEDRIAQGHDLLGWAVRFGVALIDRQGRWAALKRRWVDKLPFPSPDEAERRAATAEQAVRELLQAGDEDAAIEQALAMVTHRARAALIRARVYPASRPELPTQLRDIGALALAIDLDSLLAGELPEKLMARLDRR